MFQHFSKNIGLFYLLLGVLLLTCGSVEADDRQPNIVVIVSDDAGFADFGFQGSSDVTTPNLDSLAKTGIRFEQGYVSASVCSPSRAGLLTGRYQQRFGHEMNLPPLLSETNGLPLDEITLAEALKQAGYRTIGLGKWHLGYADHFHPLNRGFDDFYGFLQGARSYWSIDQPTKMNRLLRNQEPVKETFDYMTDELGRAAADYISTYKDDPFFMYLSYNAVHTPMHATEQDLADVKIEASDKRKKLIAMTNALDRSIGKVIDALDKHGLTENTIVFFINDNGGATNNDSDNGKLRGRKGSPFEGGIKVPFLAKWPKRWQGGMGFQYPVSSLDIFPTAIAAAGYTDQLKLQLDGVNLAGFLDKNAAESTARPHDVLYWRQNDDWAIRKDDMKLLCDNGGQTMLFDLSTDAGEKTDLAATNPEKVRELKALHDEWAEELVEPKWGLAERGGNKKKKKR